uniref:autotransporter family protein n=1 Tax=Brucella anthropi TaxID=529 RepID=UPI00236033EE
GGITKNGAGDLVLYGANDYSGTTAVNEGALVQGAGGGLSANSSYKVASGAEIDLSGLGTTMAALSNSGIVNFGGSGGTTLYVAGDYTGNGGTVVINTVLGGDHSQTDMLRVGGDTAGNTNLKVVNRNGLGGKTNNGIEVVDVAGQSNGTFSLISDYTTKDGQKAVVAGAYAYTLQQGSATGNKDGNWYLTSQLSNPNPGPNPDPDCKGDDCPNPGPGPDQRYSAGVPIYEGYVATMQALNKLPTLQERVGERYWTGKNGDGQTNGAAVDDKGVWARIEGAHNRLEPDATASMKQDINTFIMQAGVDGQFYEGDNGKLIAGITGQYGHGRADISSFSGDGDISTDAWSLGATTTWYGNNGFYVDGQAQVTWFDSDLNSDTAATGLADSRKATGYAMSIEAGQRFALDQNWSLTPQAQLSYSSINANGFNDVWDSHVSLHDGDSLIGRIGLAANYANNWKGDDGLMVNTTLYGIANLYQEMLGGAVVNVAGTDFDTNNDKTWAGIGAGGTYAWADNKYAIYGEGSVNTGLNHFADSYALKGT